MTGKFKSWKRRGRKRRRSTGVIGRRMPMTAKQHAKQNRHRARRVERKVRTQKRVP